MKHSKSVVNKATNSASRCVSNRINKIILKVVFVGDQAVGKTSLRNRYLKRVYESKYKITIGAEFSVKRFLKNSLTFTMQIWDLAGQQQFKPVRTLYYSGTMGAVVVYDVSRRETFERIPEWVEEVIHHNDDRPVPLLIIANKIDLREHELGVIDCVSREEGEILAKRLKEMLRERGHPMPVQFCEASAKLGLGVNEAIDQFLKSLVINA